MTAPGRSTEEDRIAHPRMAVGIGVGAQPPLARVRMAVALGRILRMDSLWAVDHFLGFVPASIWDRDLSWAARPGTSPDEFFDYQVLLGHLARRVGSKTLGVGVTEPIRRHPVLLAQMAMTLSHLTRRPPILGIGAGERENIEPYGIDFSQPVGVLEEALAVIRLCLTSRGPFDFAGVHFRLERAVMDLQPAPDMTPRIWVAAHGPRMLRLAGAYGDGWFPTFPMSPATYAEKLAAVHRSAVSAGREPGPIVPSLLTFIVLGRTNAIARKMLDSRVMRFAALLAGDEVWQQQGHTHPLGAGFRGMVDFVPQRYGREEMDELIAAVPVDAMAEDVVWGDPDRVVDRLRALGEAGLRHVVLAPLSALVSRRAAVDTIWGLRRVVSRLRSGR